MANAIRIPKSHLIMGLSLPLAVLVGYFVAEPMELGSLAVVVLVLVVLCIPLLMKWHYPLTVLAWNAAFCLMFLPGRVPLWAMLAFVGLLFAVLNRAVSPNARFVIEPTIIKPLLVLTAVVVVTGMMTGGFGVQMLGAGHYGGKRYFYFLASVAGYFVFTSQRIPPQRASFYVGLFFLSALTYAVSDFAQIAGLKLEFLNLFLAPQSSLREMTLEEPVISSGRVMRIVELGTLGIAVCSYLLARFGVRGLLDVTRPWRLLLLLLAIGSGLLSGFRGFVLFVGLTFVVLFCLEGLHRTRYLPAILGVLLVSGMVVLPQAERLPLMAQRALSFLPGKFDQATRESAAGTVQWRLAMWKEVLPEVPKCLFRGKGWAFDARDFYSTVELAPSPDIHAGTILVGDYHSGPLSLLLPFGIYGAVAFVWFLVAGLRVLHRNWKFGNPALRSVNALLLAAFATRSFAFFFVFGSLYSDMAMFTGLLGFSVALNGWDASQSQAEQPAPGIALNTEYIRA